VIKLKVNGKSYLIENDPQKFTAAELNAVERHTGMVVREWAEKLSDRRVSSLAWTALAWIAVRRAGQFIRWDDFEDSVSVMELLDGIEDGPDSTEPAPETAPSRRKQSTPKTA
jgi:hypothetical protein